jgi:hypothetical protein
VSEQQVEVVPSGLRLSPEASHLTCCREEDPGDTALCGTDVRHFPWNFTDPTTCVVCADLAETDACPTFGRCVDWPASLPVPKDRS